jgi:hypothetical protein
LLNSRKKRCWNQFEHCLDLAAKECVELLLWSKLALVVEDRMQCDLCSTKTLINSLPDFVRAWLVGQRPVQQGELSTRDVRWRSLTMTLMKMFRRDSRAEL